MMGVKIKNHGDNQEFKDKIDSLKKHIENYNHLMEYHNHQTLENDDKLVTGGEALSNPIRPTNIKVDNCKSQT